MTERLYLSDPYLQSFRARVTESRELDGMPAAVLDRTAFYPEGGGQPGDRGTLGSARVLDTQERDGVVLHLLDRAVAINSELEGTLDWSRRRDHMQQHHGQHLLSATFDRVLRAPTVSFHLGESACTVDLDLSISKLDISALKQVEAATNDVIWRNLPVTARSFSAEERARLDLRKEAVKGDRVVVVEGVDASPCGGTHPARTGEVGAVAILKAQRWGQGQARIEFICGDRIVQRLAAAETALAQASEALKCATHDLPEAAKRTAAESQARRKTVETLLQELARHEAARLEAAQTGPVVAAKVERGMTMARAVAAALADRGRIALVASVDEGRAHLCFARPRGDGPAMNALLQDAVQLLSGKGGGSKDFAQGSGDPLRLDEALALARARLLSD